MRPLRRIAFDTGTFYEKCRFVNSFCGVLFCVIRIVIVLHLLSIRTQEELLRLGAYGGFLWRIDAAI